MLEHDLVSQPGAPADPAEAASICVVHLARAANGAAPLRAFVDSYRTHAAGIAHELLIVFKGYANGLDAEHESILKGVTHSRHFVSDDGVDLDVYFGMAPVLTSDVLCFLNSFSAIQSDDWLVNLFSALSLPATGLVGATGSWQSIYLSYTDLVPDPAARARQPAWRRAVLRLFPFLRMVKRRVYGRRLRLMFDVFPNPHVRTNAFMIWRELALAIEIGPLRSKLDAYALESGKSSLTAQILQMNRQVLIVDRNGRSYAKDSWHESNTFWRKGQDNLMVADNQTRAYDRADPEERSHYSTLAWGPNGDASIDT
jgi:hypothetical protein